MSDQEAPAIQREPELPKARPRRRWVSLVLAAVIFLCGCVVGGGGTVLLLRKHLLHAVKHPEEAPARITRGLRRHLGLSDSQATEVEAVLRKHQGALQAIRADAQPQVETVLAEAEKDVAEVLDESQRERWHAKFKRMRDLWLPPRPPGSGPTE